MPGEEELFMETEHEHEHAKHEHGHEKHDHDDGKHDCCDGHCAYCDKAIELFAQCEGRPTSSGTVDSKI